jgi:hypothetical protein
MFSYIITFFFKNISYTFMCGKGLLKIKIMDQFWKVFFLSFKYPHILRYYCFLMWLTCIFPLNFFPIKCVFII